MATSKYPYLSWRGRVVENDQCLSCLRTDGSHDDECEETPLRELTPTEQSELAWLNDRFDAILAERVERGDETLHWQEHKSICRSFRAIVSGAEAGASPCSDYRPHQNLTGLDGTPLCVCGFERRQH